MNEPYYFTRVIGYQCETRCFEHSYQLHAAVLDFKYSLPGYFSDRPMKIPDDERIVYGINEEPQQPSRTISEQFSPSKVSHVYSNTVAKGSFVKIKNFHKNTDLMIVQGKCLRSDSGNEIPVWIYDLIDIDFRTGQGEMIIIKEPNL